MSLEFNDILLYTAAHGKVRIDVIYEEESFWLSQKKMAELFDVSVPTIQQIVCDWVRYLKEELLWGNDDPLFPKTHVVNGDDRFFKAAGFKPEHWRTASPIRAIFRQAFEAADLPYFNPHSFRNTLVKLGQQLCLSPEEFKSWIQNLGHEDVLTTLYSYGEVQQHRQGEILQQLKTPRVSNSQNADDIARAVVKAMYSQNLHSRA